MAVGKEAFGLYLLDKKLVKDVQITSSQEISSYSKLLYAANRSSDIACIQTSRKLDFEVWHKRIGHVLTNKIKLLPIDVILPKGIQDVPCDVCPKARQQRLSFHLSTISSNATFELIHVGTWGPIILRPIQDIGFS